MKNISRLILNGSRKKTFKFSQSNLQISLCSDDYNYSQGFLNALIKSNWNSFSKESWKRTSDISRCSEQQVEQPCHNTLQQQLVYPKDKTTKHELSNTHCTEEFFSPIHMRGGKKTPHRYIVQHRRVTSSHQAFQ